MEKRETVISEYTFRLYVLWAIGNAILFLIAYIWLQLYDAVTYNLCMGFIVCFIWFKLITLCRFLNKNNRIKLREKLKYNLLYPYPVLFVSLIYSYMLVLYGHKVLAIIYLTGSALSFIITMLIL